MLVNSATNDRGDKVEDYDVHVNNWVSSGRASFLSADVQVLALGTTTLRGSMKSSDGAEKDFRDAEHGSGLLTYLPLKFEHVFQFDSYYPASNAQTEDEIHWDPLPEREAAKRVTFEFAIRSGNGTQSKFSLPALPLVYDEVVRARTPAPENKCKREQNGMWRQRRCHVVKRLSQICVQVEMNERGQWIPRLQDAAVDGASARNGTLISGCGPDAHNSWSVETYITDACWGANPARSSCAAQEKDHIVQVTLRSASDPFIRAEELTGTSLNFGMSPGSQRSLGITTLSIGLVLGIVPVLRVREIVKKSNRREDARGLRHHRDDPEDQKIGIYGNRMI